ncbi:unnamed protein product [Vitrella brassicaformis CCMP3155]|uniref:phenylalanine--tRNA ligase n=1 Tax=Vitrella brassicaformis (strain CCMP3155) TaxID=1169540 RepID=A0A0G4ENS5_VITBC|nr:unnamed protein product [Vitrella brassicaformis CCMP3155]|mmetsp:Transcript_24693/g.61027  ORF Transcript_24693/g.61027 Transcript_24693/m.61027 type:complete len:684 (-) Transcript_24693:285-2336(-)|eukprot:CEL98513.1 unnamed protein product [Vitrella brassicaformis CCMP3155]
MPTVSVVRDELFAHLGETLTDKEFDQLCFDFGIELDEVTSAQELARKEKGDSAAGSEEQQQQNGDAGVNGAAGVADDVIYKIEVPANRYDLLCVEGISKALRVFKQKDDPPVFTLEPSQPNPDLKITVEPQTGQVRPYIVGAVLRGVSFTPQMYASFIDLQDKLHHNICRRRTLVAIGTHDLDTLKGPFRYRALPPSEIQFVPLNQTESVDGNQLMAMYESHQQLKAYLPIIRDSPVYPIIYDSDGVVLSLPPIINGDHSKITLNTRNIFIECTATDLTKAQIVINTLVAMFSPYCAKPYKIEPVLVEYEPSHPKMAGGQTRTYPSVDSRPVEANVSYVQKLVGVTDSALMGPDRICQLLKRMSIPSERLSDDTVRCHVPITRSDVLHACDLAEDVAIAYGYNNVKAEIPPTLAWPSEQPIGHLSDLIRHEFAQAGFNECLTWGLCSSRENFECMRRTPRADEDADLQEANLHIYQYDAFARPVRLSNPKTKEFEVVRTSLLPMLLKTLAANKKSPLPIKLFEVSDVVVIDKSTPTGARNVRRAAALYSNLTSGFEVIHGLMDLILSKLSLTAAYNRPDATPPPTLQHQQQQQQVVDGVNGHHHVAANPGPPGGPDYPAKTYYLRPSNDTAFFEGRQAHIVVGEVVIGVVGVVHPAALKGFAIDTPVSAMEINLEPFMEWLAQ